MTYRIQKIRSHSALLLRCWCSKYLWMILMYLWWRNSKEGIYQDIDLSYTHCITSGNDLQQRLDPEPHGLTFLCYWELLPLAVWASKSIRYFKLHAADVIFIVELNDLRTSKNKIMKNCFPFTTIWSKRWPVSTLQFLCPCAAWSSAGTLRD